MSDTEFVSLPVNAPGTQRALKVLRFGRAGARPKVYIQAGIHADELPANLVAHHLAGRLAAEHQKGRVQGEIVLVPVANPIGLSNIVLNDHLGRYHAQSGQNFNRGWPNVAEAVAAQVRGKLGADAEQNLALVRQTIAEQLRRIKPEGEADTLRLLLMRLAADADIVLDLHTDSEAELHLYLDTDQWPAASDLAALLDAVVVMFARNSGNDPFEETVALPYIRVKADNPERPLAAPLATVIELRGQTDVSDELATRDAGRIFRFLQHRRIVEGAVEPVPPFNGIAAPFEATEIVRAPAAGIVVYKRELGDVVAAGDLIAEIVDPLGQTSNRVQVTATAAGRFFTRSRVRLAWPGAALGKIQSDRPLPGRESGRLLYD